MHPNLIEIDHPLMKHKLTILRNAETTTDNFRRVVREIAAMMAYEVTRDLQTEQVPITTPVAQCEAPVIAGKKLCLISIMRAGNGMLDGMIELLPGARIGHVGLYRDPHTLEPIEYYYKVPEDIEERHVIVVDPMLATGNSASAALSRLKEDGVSSLKFVCLLAAPEGLKTLARNHPDVPVTTGAIDSHLDEHGYIIPGLGDAGDRLFGTR